MKNCFSKGKIVCFVFMLLLLILSFVIHSYSLRKTMDPDLAIVEYSNFIRSGGKHNAKRLKNIIYLQLKQRDPKVRRCVAEVLGELGDADVFDDLWDIIKYDISDSVRNVAVAGLLNYEDKVIIKYLVILLDDDVVDVRRLASLGCGEYGDKSLLNELKDAFPREMDRLVKINIAAAMLKFGDEQHLKYVQDAFFKDKNVMIRKHVAQTLHYFDINFDEEMLKDAFIKERNQDVKVWIACLLAKREDSASLKYLKTLLSKSNSSLIKSEITYALTEINEFEYAYSYLLELLENENALIRERAIEDLVDYKEYPLVPIFGKVLLNDESVIIREIGAWALGERREEEAIPYLEKGLLDSHAFVRTGSAAALYKILTSRSDVR